MTENNPQPLEEQPEDIDQALFAVKEGASKRGFAWLFGARLSTLAIMLITTSVLARYLSPHDFGLMVAATIIIALANAIFDGAFGTGLVRRADLDDDHIASVTGAALLVSSVLVVLVVAMSSSIERFFHVDNLAIIINVAALAIILKALFAVAAALLQRRGDFRRLAIISAVATPVGSLGVSVPLAMLGFGTWALVSGTLVTGVLEAGLTWFVARPPMRAKLSRQSLDEVRGGGAGFALNQALNWAALSGANIVAGHMLGILALGIYSRGWRLLDIAVSATSGPMQRVLLPLFAKKQHDVTSSRIAFLEILGALAPVFTVLSVLPCLHAEALVRILLGTQWMDVIPIVQILFSALVARSLYKLSEGVAIAFGKARAAIIRQAIYAILMVGGAIAGSFYGAKGIALATSIAVWCFYLMSVLYTVSLLKCHIIDIANIHLRSLVWALLTVLISEFFNLLMFDLPFWYREVANMVLSSSAIVALAAYGPSRLSDPLLARELRKIVERLASKIGLKYSPSRSQDRAVICYAYCAPLPNTMANSGAVLSLCDGLSASGLNVVISYEQSVASANDIAEYYALENRVEFSSVKPIRSCLYYFSIALKILAKWRSASIITRSPQVAVIAAAFGRRTVLELHQHLYTTSRWPLWRQLARLCSRGQLQVAALTHSIAENLDPIVRAKAGKLVVIPSASRDLGGSFPLPKFDVGYVGSFMPGKGIEMVLRLASLRPHLTFILYGSYDESSVLVEKLRALKNVTLAGRFDRNGAAEALHSFRIGLAPYDRSGFGGVGQPFVSVDSMSSLKIIEYMSASRTILSSNVSSVASMFDAGEPAVLLCDPDDEAAWLDALDQLVGDQDLRERLAHNARATYVRSYSMESRAQAFRAIVQPS